MRTWLWMVLACCAGVFFPARAQEVVAGIECPTCKGKTRAVQACRQCAGTGTLRCRSCGPPVWDVELSLSEASTAEERQKLAEALRAAYEAVAKLNAATGRTPVVGRVPCPMGTCSDGKVLLRGGLECKYCAGKGSFACPDCDKKGRQRCLACAGRGKLERLCDDCAGAGRLPDPATRAPEQRATCAWCDGCGARECRECDAAGQIVKLCPECRGAKQVTCRKSVGTKLMPCRTCWATGRIEAALNSLEGDRDCDRCDQTGRIECDECGGKGTRECKTCKGAGRLTLPCPASAAEHRRPCVGCAFDAHRSWLVCADILAARGASQDAASYLAVAFERVDPLFDRRVREHVGPQVQRDAIEKGRVAAKKELEKRIAALRRKPG